MNQRNGILIDSPAQRRRKHHAIEGERDKKPQDYRGPMIEMYMTLSDGTEASVIMPDKPKWTEQYIKESWKVRSRWET